MDRRQIAPEPMGVTFYGTAGAKLGGDLYVPPGAGPAEFPGVVLCQGFGGVKEQVRAWGERLAAEGFIVLVPDYRGFGASEGHAGRIVPQEQAEDIRAGMSFLETDERCHRGGVGLIGISFGGAIATFVGGVDPRCRAVVSIVGWGDGRRYMRAVRRLHEWRSFSRRVTEDRGRRTLTGESEQIDPDEILVRDPESLEWRREMEEQVPEMRFLTTLESADRIIEFVPEQVLPFPHRTAFLAIHAEDDDLVPVAESVSMYHLAREPKRIVILPGIAHHGVHEGEAFERVMAEMVAWLRRHLLEELPAGQRHTSPEFDQWTEERT